MTGELYLNGEPLHFSAGLPPLYSGYQLPNANSRHVQGQWGLICLQEIKSEHYLLRHFFFSVKQSLFLKVQECGEGIQSLISLKGELDYSVKGLPTISVQEKEFHLLNAQDETAIIGLKWGKACSVFNAYYASPVYEDLLPYFPSFRKYLKKSRTKPFHFLSRPKAARPSVHDAIQDIWLDRYASRVAHKYIEKRLEASLITMLAETYTPSVHDEVSPKEREKAAAARTLILTNIRKHLRVEEIAGELHCSPSWLQKAFSKVYGMGPRHFLRRERMMLAKEMLLKGESLKAVAIEVGMKPRHFPEEFKSFFGYTVTDLKKGKAQ